MSSKGEVPHLQGGQILGQLLFELDGRQGWGVRHKVPFSEGAALRGALTRLLFPLFTLSRIVVKP